MPTYRIQQYESHLATYKVVAPSPGQALAKVLRGDAEANHVCDDYSEVDWGRTGTDWQRSDPALETAVDELKQIEGMAKFVDYPTIQSIGHVEVVSEEE